MRHQLYLRTCFKQGPLHSSAMGDYVPPESTRVLDGERNEVIAPRDIKRNAVVWKLYRAMTMGWKSFAPYS